MGCTRRLRLVTAVAGYGSGCGYTANIIHGHAATGELRVFLNFFSSRASLLPIHLLTHGSALCAAGPVLHNRPAMKALPKIPGFELLTCLGGGSLTSVYAARATESDTTCALKLLRPDWQDQPVAIKLLQREARACLAVQHPHLVKLIDAHVTRDPYFLVMEMLPGESLRRRL